MKTYIYMNEQLKAKRPAHGVITVKRGKLERTANEVQLNQPHHPFAESRVVHSDCGGIISVYGQTLRVRFDPKGCPGVKSHNVRAWVEVE